MKTSFKIGAISIPTEVAGKVVSAKIEGIELSLEDLSVVDLIRLLAIIPDFLADLKGQLNVEETDEDELDFPFPGGAVPLFSGILGKPDQLEKLFGQAAEEEGQHPLDKLFGGIAEGKEDAPKFDFEKVIGKKNPLEGLAGLGKPGILPGGLGQGGMFAIDMSKIAQAGPLGDILKAIIEAKQKGDK